MYYVNLNNIKTNISDLKIYHIKSYIHKLESRPDPGKNKWIIILNNELKLRYRKDKIEKIKQCIR